MEKQNLNNIDELPSDNEIEQKSQQKPIPPKPKRVISEKQKENLKKGRELRDEIRKQRLEEHRQENERRQKEIEEKIVKKAITIKKKQIKQEKILELSEHDSDIEIPRASVKPVIQRQPVQRLPAPPPPTPRQRQIIYV